ncbi:hypothetical protein J2Y65_002396 [Aeromonas salmonicida]|nr:hypothetical protein [Aeromonas salmonicida]MDR6995714.1 hypothetical protein [Aeromonas salmonicida]
MQDYFMTLPGGLVLTLQPTVFSQLSEFGFKQTARYTRGYGG